ncbi:MAG: hypothetical protein Kow0059_18870 [Candidatus Sumerlaeia bacterium]
MRNWIFGLITGAILAASAVPTSAPAQQSKMEYLTALAGGQTQLAVKMSSDLLQTRAAVQAGKSLQDAAGPHLSHSVRNGALQCIVGLTGPASDDFQAACRAAGLTVVGVNNFPDIGLYHAVVQCSDPRRLDALALRPDVRLIRAEPLAQTMAGAVTAQSDVSINADDARATYSINGSGVRVGVLSDTFHRVIGGTLAGGFLTGSSSQTSGDLPASIRVIDPGPTVGTDEGAAMAELVYDLAPGCDISFASAFTSYSSFATNITALRTDGLAPAKVIVDDVIYYSEPMYQDGPIAIAARNSGLAGVPYFSSAGNFAAQGHERTYSDVNPGTDDTAPLPSGADLHDFGAAKGMPSDTHLQVNLAPNGRLTAALHWDEPYGGGLASGPGSEADLDLYVVSSTAVPITAPIVLAQSINSQGQPGSPSGDAVEELQYTNTSGSPQTVYVVVEHYWGREPLTLHLLLSLGGAGGTIVDSGLLGDRTLFGHAAAANVQAVAAIFYGEIDAGGNLDPPTGQLDVEPFSALGSTALPFWFSDDGNTRYGTAQTRQKPDIAAPDGANTTFFGVDTGFDPDSFPEFFGTSAAAPHAAAVAALLLDYNSALTSAQVYQALSSTAVDAESSGVDALSGYGSIDALAAVTFVATLGVKDWFRF